MPSCSRNLLTPMFTNRKESSSPPVNMMPNLPDELLLNCLARVSRLYYPTLSLVSKRFHSLLASTELYRTRRLLGTTESCIYACLVSPFISNKKLHWRTLGWKQTRVAPSWNNPFKIVRNRTRTSSLSGNLLVSVPHNFGHDDPYMWTSTIVGYDIYMMMYTGKPSSRVFVMDCRVHTWREAPSMLVAKKNPLACVLDGKIYVVEKSTDGDFSNFIEFFDPETNIWEHVPSPSAEMYGTKLNQCCAFKGNLHLLYFREKAVVYNPKENIWDVEAIELGMLLSCTSFFCMIDNIFYMYKGGSIRRLEWYDHVGNIWGALKGMEELPKLPKSYCSLRVENCGGKIVLLWEENVRSVCFTKEKMIWCAEIAVERRNSVEIYGKVKWCDVVLRVPKSCKLQELFVANI